MLSFLEQNFKRGWDDIRDRLLLRVIGQKTFLDQKKRAIHSDEKNGRKKGGIRNLITPTWGLFLFLLVLNLRMVNDVSEHKLNYH